MKAYIVAAILTVGFALPALAAEKFFMTVDTVGNCSVVQGGPSAGQTAFGETGGYDTAEAADKALAEARKDTEKCKGVVE
jgi:hypothetical protein